MDVELARRLRNVEIVLKEAIDRVERVLIERLDGVFLERFGQEHLAQRRRQLINDAADAEVVIVNDRLLVFKHLADLDGDLRLLIAVGQLAQVVGRRADADDTLTDFIRWRMRRNRRPPPRVPRSRSWKHH